MGLRERWMKVKVKNVHLYRASSCTPKAGGQATSNALEPPTTQESRCYFLSYAQKVGVRCPPLQKVEVRVPTVSYAYDDWPDKRTIVYNSIWYIQVIYKATEVILSLFARQIGFLEK